jgi:hypothetical protein
MGDKNGEYPTVRSMGRGWGVTFEACFIVTRNLRRETQKRKLCPQSGHTKRNTTALLLSCVYFLADIRVFLPGMVKVKLSLRLTKYYAVRIYPGKMYD